MTKRRTQHPQPNLWRQKHDALLTVLNAVLLAYGSGPDKRIAVAQAYYVGQRRRNVAVETLGDRIVIYLEPAKEDTTDA